MASFSSTYPAQRPIFSLDAANAGRLDPRMTFSRASTGTYFGTEKVLSSENLLLQSSNFHTTWGISDAGRTAGVTAPNGSSDASTLTSNTGSNISPRLNQSLSGKLSTSTQYTMVGHVKAGTATHGYISFRGNNSNNYAYAQIEFASPSSVSTGGAGFTGISGTVTALGSSWYRLTLTATTGSDVSGAFAFLGLNDGTAFSSGGYPLWSPAGETLDVWGAQISSTQTKVYDSPTTTQIARSYQTKLQTAASGAARFEHSASDGQSAGTSLGILVEGQSTNLHRYGSDVANWANSANRTVSSNAAVAPDGSLTADLVVATSTAGFHYVGDFTVSITSGTTYTASFYVRDAGQRYVQLVGDSAVFGTGIYANYDLNDGTYSATGCTASASNVGNSWWRLTITAAATTTGTGNYALALGTSKSNGRLPSFSGNDYAGVLVWGAQLEASNFASSLVDTGTSGSTATRASDSLSVATADIGYTGGPVSVVAQTEAGAGLGDNPRLFSLNDGSDATRLLLYKNSASADNTVAWTAYYGSSSMGSLAGSNNSSIVAVSADTNDFAAASDTGTLLTNASGSLHSFSHLYIGSNYNGTAHQLNGHIKRVALYNEALSDTNLQALTS